MILASFIIPVHNREKTIDRAIGSIVNSGMVTDKGAYEVIIVDDASVDKTYDRVKRWCDKYPKNVLCLRFKDHSERVIATNAGIMQARGEWIVRFDSDDEMATHFKKAFEDAIEMNPDRKIFNWGSVVHWRNKDGKYYRSSIRNPFHVTIGVDGKVEPFKSGGICAGGFAFKRSLMFKGGFLPEARNPYSFGKLMKGQHPEIKALYGDKDDLGNPWGDDYSIYFKITRHEVPCTIDEILHIQHVRQ